MPRLELTLEDQLMNDLTTMALKQGISSETLCLEVLKRHIKNSKLDIEEPGRNVYERYIDEVIIRISRFKKGTKFSLNGNYKDSIPIFSKDEWSEMTKKNGFAPNIFGKRFAQYVERHKDQIIPSDKASDNKQRYILV